MRGDWRVVKVNPFRGQYPPLRWTLTTSPRSSLPTGAPIASRWSRSCHVWQSATRCCLRSPPVRHILRSDKTPAPLPVGLASDGISDWAAVRSRLVDTSLLRTRRERARRRLRGAERGAERRLSCIKFLSSGSNADAPPAPGTGADEAPTRYYTFDVAISIHKARNLPSPPALAGGPLVAIRWGAPAPPHVSLMSTAASSTSVAGASSRRGSSVVGLSAQHPLTESSPLGDAAAGADEDAEDGLYAPVRAQRPQGMATRATSLVARGLLPLPRFGF